MYNCVIIDDESIAREALMEYIARVPFLNLLGSYESPLGIMELTERIDIIFSDIRMPEMDGVVTARPCAGLLRLLHHCLYFSLARKDHSQKIRKKLIFGR